MKTYKYQIIFLALPMAAILFYLYGFCVEKYSSYSTYRIQDNGSSKTMALDLGIFGGGASSQKQDSGVLESYLNSYDTLALVEKEFGFNAHYHSLQTDIFDRLFSFSSRKDFLDVFRKNLSIIHDDMTGLTTITFFDSSPERARNVVKFLLNQGEIFLNRLNRQNAAKKLSFISEQLQKNQDAMDCKIKMLEAFQNKHRLLDPQADVAVQHSIIATLESRLVEKNAELNQLEKFMNKDAYEVVRMADEAQEFKDAIATAKAKLTGQKDLQLNDLLFQHTKLQAQVDFASEVYKQTLVQYEVSRIEALQEAKQLEIITLPTLPDEYASPDKLKTLATVAVLLLIFFKVFQLVMAVVKDHKD